MPAGQPAPHSAYDMSRGEAPGWPSAGTGEPAQSRGRMIGSQR